MSWVVPFSCSPRLGACCSSLCGQEHGRLTRTNGAGQVVRRAPALPAGRGGQMVVRDGHRHGREDGRAGQRRHAARRLLPAEHLRPARAQGLCVSLRGPAGAVGEDDGRHEPRPRRGAQEQEAQGRRPKARLRRRRHLRHCAGMCVSRPPGTLGRTAGHADAGPQTFSYSWPSSTRTAASCRRRRGR